MVRGDTLLIYIKSTKHKMQVCLIDKDDFNLVKKHTWYLHETNTSFYCQTAQANNIYLHNLIMGCKWVDHINNNGLDNRRSNLRKCTQQENNFNKTKVKNAFSEYKGVFKSRYEGKCKGVICHEYKQISLGIFTNQRFCGFVYDIAAKILFKDFAGLNFEDKDYSSFVERFKTIDVFVKYLRERAKRKRKYKKNNEQ